jgi:threonine/homoserine/homoserine lactone efflux protein
MKIKDSNATEVSNKMNFLSGCMIAFSNPKAIVFYLGFLPAFIDLNNLILKEIVIITILIPISLASVLIIYSFIASKAKKIMQTDSSILLLNRISSVMMFIVAIILINT